jgi:translation initiation factor IF-2
VDGSQPRIEPASTAPPVSAGPASSASGAALVPPPLPSAQPTKAAKPPKPDPPAPAPLPFSAIAGFRCPDTASGGYTQHVGSANWYLVTGGGWTGDGCQGHLIAMPMSGDPNRDDLNNVILWWFKVPSRPRCAVEVYVPGGPNLRDAAGAPATYFVYGTTDGSGSPIGQFGIDQVHNQGRWVAVGGFPATSGQLSVRLMSRGVSNISGAHLGGSAVRISC